MILPNQRLRSIIPNFNNPSPENPDQGSVSPMSPIATQALLNPDMEQQQNNENNYPTPMLNRYSAFLDELPPNYEDYKPSIGRRLLAGLAAWGTHDPNAAMYVNNAPYQRAISRYDMRANQLQKGAQIEEQGISNKRQIARDQSLAESRAEANRIREQLGEAQNTIRQQNADTAKEKSDKIYEVKIKELEAKVEKAEKDRDEKAREADKRSDDAAALRALHEAEMRARDARHALDLAQRDRQLAEVKRQHDEQMKKRDAEIEDIRSRTENRGKDTTKQTTLTTDEKGNVTGKTEVTSRNPKGQPAPVATGKLRVKRLSDGQTGTIDAKDFDPKVYQKIQ